MKKILFLLILIITVLACEKKAENEIVIHTSYDYTENDYKINDLLYEGLVKENEKGELIPALAEKWEVSQDKKKWTFHLRDNLKYSDGSPIKTAHFIPLWAKETSAENNKFKRHIKFTEINGKIFTIELKDINERDKDNYLSAIYMIIKMSPDKRVLKNGYEYDENLETGAYTLKKMSIDKIILEKNLNYWNSKNLKAQTIVFKYIKDSSVSLKEFEKGKADIVQIISQKDMEKFKNSSELNKIETKQKTYLTFNDRLDMFQNPNVKRAVIMAIKNKKDFTGIYAQKSYISEDVIKAVSPVIPEYNPEEAKKLLEKEIGNVKNLPVLEFISYNPENREKALEIKKNLEKNLGLKIKLIFSYNKKYEKSYAFKMEDDIFGNPLFDYHWIRGEGELVRKLDGKLYKSEKNNEKIKLMTELSQLYAKELPFLLINDKVYRYYLISSKVKEIKIKAPYGEYIIN